MTALAGTTLVRDDRGLYHRAAKFGARLVAHCETGHALHSVVRIPDDVSEDQLCERCWSWRPSDTDHEA